MGFQLWYSEDTGIRRKGTSFTELQNIFISEITTKFIFEPLACCQINDNPFDVKGILRQRDFDTLGVIDETGEKVGYLLREDLDNEKIKKHVQEFKLSEIISDSTPLSELLDILKDREFVFVLSKSSIDGIVTRADFNKPILRIYLFGLISLFELHLNYWILRNHHDNLWERNLNNSRRAAARKIFEERKGNNIQLTLLECIQICDKRDILLKTKAFIEQIDFSKNNFKKLLTNVEKIRNELAHSQNSIISNLEWREFVKTIGQVKEFLESSENKIIK